MVAATAQLASPTPVGGDVTVREASRVAATAQLASPTPAGGDVTVREASRVAATAQLADGAAIKQRPSHHCPQVRFACKISVKRRDCGEVEKLFSAD